MDSCSLAYSGNVSRAAFHNLTSYCNNNGDVSEILIFPSTFFIQLLRFSLSICAIILLSALYNAIRVMNRQILSTATCSMFWVAMCSMLTLKSVVLMVFPVVSWNWKDNTTESQQEEDLPGIVGEFNMAGFILQALLQSAAVLMLFIALDHERCFRSSDYATVDLPAKHCVAVSCRFKEFCSWPRVVALVLTATPLLLLVAIELVYHFYKIEHIPTPLLWVYIASLPLTRLSCVVVGVVLVLMRQEKLAPTIPAKFYLMFGLGLSLVEDFPNFVTGCNHVPCLLEVLSLFDLIQLLGICSLVFFVLFVRSQYLRVEQESKLNLVCELQKLLQVNGRKDIITHYT